MIMRNNIKKLEEQNEFLKDMIKSLEDAKAGRVKDIKCLLKN